MFNVGDTVVKSSIGICKIKAIRRVEIDGQTDDYYVIQSGEAEVLVPRKLADHGAIRSPMDPETLEKVFAALEAPMRPIRMGDGDELPENYKTGPTQFKGLLKRRDPIQLVEMIRLLFNKQQDFTLDKKENLSLNEGTSLLVEEISFLQKTTKARVKTQINKALIAARKEGRRQLAADDL